MSFTGSPPRARLALGLSGVFSWLTMSPCLAARLVTIPAHQRLLTQTELRLIKGAQMIAPGGIPPQNPTEEPNAGGTFPWEGSAGDLNTLNGNKLTSIPLVHWTARGGLPVALTLYHNSAATTQSELGNHWTHSYAIYGTLDQPTGDFTVQWGDNLEYTFVRNLDGSFTAPEGIFETLSLDSTTQTYLLTRKNQVRYTFSQPNGVRWNCTRISDRNNNAITIQHNASDFVSQVSDPSGRSLSFSYSGSTLTGITDPLGRVFQFTHSAGNLSQIAFPEVVGQVPTIQFLYNASHNIVQLTDRRGKCWTFGYTGNGRVLAWEKNPLLQETSYLYTPGQTQIIDPRGNATTHSYESGLLTRTEDPTRAAILYGYTGTLRTSATDQEGYTTLYTYDSRGNLLTITDALGNVTMAQYSAKNDPIRLTGPSGRQLLLSYDASGNLVQRTDPLQKTTQFTVNALGQLVTVRDPLGRATHFAYDLHGNRTQVTDALGRVRTWGYDLLGRTVSQSVAGQLTQFSYNPQGQVSQRTEPGNRVTLFDYDLAGNLLTTTNALGQVDRLAYDALGRRVGHADALGRSTEVGYDASGNRVRFTDGRGKSTLYSYDSRNLLTNIAYPDATSQSYSYSPRGLLTGRTDGRGVSVGILYDARGSVLGMHYSDGTPDVTFVFDSDGQKISMTGGSGTTHYTYDSAGQLRQQTTPQGVVAFLYDDAGQVLSRVGGGTSTTYGYDAAGQLTCLTEGGTQTTNYAYDLLGRLTTTALPSGVIEARAYNDAGDLVKIESTKLGQTLTRQEYRYDALGRKVGEQAADAILSYVYDAAGQLLNEMRVGLNPYTVQYSYDAAGNRLSQVRNGVLESYAYDDANKLISAGGKLYFYDLAGNVTGILSASGSTRLSWDAESRLRSATQGSASVAYEYNGLGQRVGKTGSRNARYLLTDDTIDAPILNDGSARYTHGVTGLLSENRDALTRYFHTDALGSVRAQTDAIGGLCALQSTDAFGIPSTSSSSPSPYGFVGSERYQQDTESGFVHVGHRMYDPTIGRFLSRDPIQAGSNWYTYCENDPLNAIDPEGLDKIVVTWTGSHSDKKASLPIYDGDMKCYDDNGRLIWTMPIDSGGHNRGILPPGKYIVPQQPRQSESPGATGGKFTPLDPRFDTRRFDLGIHFDGNLPGTSGCIGIKSWEDYQRWLEYMRKLKVDKKHPLPVIVEPLPKQLPPDRQKKKYS